MTPKRKGAVRRRVPSPPSSTSSSDSSEAVMEEYDNRPTKYGTSSTNPSQHPFRFLSLMDRSESESGEEADHEDKGDEEDEDVENASILDRSHAVTRPLSSTPLHPNVREPRAQFHKDKVHTSSIKKRKRPKEKESVSRKVQVVEPLDAPGPSGVQRKYAKGHVPSSPKDKNRRKELVASGHGKKSKKKASSAKISGMTSPAKRGTTSQAILVQKSPSRRAPHTPSTVGRRNSPQRVQKSPPRRAPHTPSTVGQRSSPQRVQKSPPRRAPHTPSTVSRRSSPQRSPRKGGPESANPIRNRPAGSKAVVQQENRVVKTPKPTARPVPASSETSTHQRKGTPYRLLSKEAKDKRMCRQIWRIQQQTQLMIRRQPFVRVVKETLQTLGVPDLRWTPDALNALQEATEMALVTLFEQAYLCCLHAKRVTLKPQDLQLASFLTRFLE